MKMPIYNWKNCTVKMLILVFSAFLVMVAGGQCPVAASTDISDVPLESMEQAAPGMIMFVIDDSGSMDFSMMCPPSANETDGVFDENYYIFHNAGDNAYSGAYYSQALQDNPSDLMMWKSQWSGYNGMYYDPTSKYTPWPGKSDVNPDTPPSNPMNSSPTFDLRGTWTDWSVTVDNRDSGYTDGSDSNYGGWSNNSQGYNGNSRVSGKYTHTYFASWTADLDKNTDYKVQVRWVARNSSPPDNVTYHIYNGANEVLPLQSTQTVDQTSSGDSWFTIAPDVSFSSGIGKVEINQTASNYQLSADAVRFVPVVKTVHDIALRHYYVQWNNNI
jgi:type IV pilus assembly protein PilY1